MLGCRRVPVGWRRWSRSEAPAALRPPREEHLWELAAGAERGAGAVQPTSGHLYNWKCFQEGEKKNLKEGGIFFFFFCTFKYFFSPPSCFSSFWVSRCREPLPCRERWKDGEAAKCRRGAGGSCPHPRSRSGGSHGAAPTGTPHPGGPWHTWVPSLSLPSCETGRGSGRGDTARGAPGGSGDLRPMGTAGAAGGSGGSGIGTRPGKSCPTWAG